MGDILSLMNNNENNNKNTLAQIGEQLGKIPFVRAWKEKSEERKNTDPEVRVNEMNGCFDRIVLPVLFAALILFLVFGIMPKLSCSDCGGKDAPPSVEDSSFETRREILLNSFTQYIPLLEHAGFLYDPEGDYAFISYNDGIDIIEHYTDSSGSACSLIMNSSIGGEEDMATIWYYSPRLMLVMVTHSGKTVSAVFTDESFTKGVSGSDISDVLDVIETSELSDMLDRYKEAINSVFE